jgi:hypothetical protein
VSTHLESPRVPDVERPAGRADAPVLPTPAPIARFAAMLAVGTAIVALVLGVLGLTLLRGGGAGEVVDGVIEATLAVSGDRVQLVVGDPVPQLATLRTEDGAATIRVGDGDLRLEDGSTLVVDDGGLGLERGHLLVSSRAAVRVEVATVVAEGRGVWRVDLGATSRIGTYRGRVQADDGRRTQQLARFEQIDLRGASLTGAAVPLRYSDQDEWDREHLADALATDRLARQLVTSLEADHGSAPRPPAFYSSFAGADGSVLARLEDLAPRRQATQVGPPATVLLGIAVADALVVDGGFLPATAVGRVVELRRGGAGWGLVLLTHDLGPSSLRAAAERALERAAEDPPSAAGTVPATGAGRTDGEPGQEPTGDEPEAPQGGAAPAGPPAPDPSPSPPPSPSPSPSPDPSPSPSPGGGALDPVEDLVQEGSETLSDLLEGTTGAAAGLIGTVADLPAPTGGLLGGADLLVGPVRLAGGAGGG